MDTEDADYKVVTDTGFLVQEFADEFFQEALDRALSWAWDSSQRCYIEQRGEPTLVAERRNFSMYEFIPDGLDRDPELVHKLAYSVAITLDHLLAESEDVVVEYRRARRYAHMVSFAVVVEMSPDDTEGVDPVTDMVRQVIVDCLAHITKG